MNFIVAVDQHYGIGKNNQLLTYIPNDLPRFKKITYGKTIVMGRKTLESLPGGKPLVGRKNIVLSKDPFFKVEGATVVNDISELFDDLGANHDDVFVIGGGIIYNLLMPYCQYAYITKMEKVFEADTFINNIEKMTNWQLVEKSEVFDHEGMAYHFDLYKNDNVLTVINE